MQQKSEIYGLVLLLSGSERMAQNIAPDYYGTLAMYRAKGVEIDADRWLVLTLISYGYGVDKFGPVAANIKPRTAARLKPTKAQIAAALLTVPFPERFCFLLRYALGWELGRIARLMLVDTARIERALAQALCMIRENILGSSLIATAGRVDAESQAR